MGEWSGPHGIEIHPPADPAKVQAVLDAGAELATSASMLLSFAHDPPEVVRGALRKAVGAYREAVAEARR